VYAGTKPAGLFVSSDGGQSWDELIGFKRIPWRWLWFSPAEKPFIGYVQAIAISPSDPGHLMVGIEAGATVLSRDPVPTESAPGNRGVLADSVGTAPLPEPYETASKPLFRRVLLIHEKKQGRALFFPELFQEIREDVRHFNERAENNVDITIAVHVRCVQSEPSAGDTLAEC